MSRFKVRYGRAGNIKVGLDGNIATWSVLKGSKDYYIPELNMYVKGTCGHYCKFCEGPCYVEKSYKRWTKKETGECSVKKGHAINTLAMREDINQCYIDLHNQIKRAKNPFKIIRINQSGEIENEDQLEMHCKLADDFPKVDSYIYTKAYDIVIPHLLEGRVPENLTVLISIWHEQGIEEYNKVKHLSNVKAFVYIDGFDYAAHGLEIQTMCMAYNEKGKMNHEVTCDKCKKCFNRSAFCKIIGCYDH